VPAGFMEKAGDYHFVIRAKDAHGHLEKGHREKWALERGVKWWILPAKVRLYYHNQTEPARAYPLLTDTVAVRAIVWANSPEGYWAYCGMQFDPDQSGNWFDNDGHWYETGRSGDPIPDPNGRGSWQGHQWPCLDPQTAVYSWPGLRLNFSWYRLQSKVDKEDQLTAIHKYTAGGTVYRPFYYPPYAAAPISGWGTDALPLNPGSSRYIVHVTWTDESGQQQLLRSLAPTPGGWAPRETDQENAVLTRTWSQNCDEPPDTVGPEEWAVRISVRDPTVTSPDARKQEYLRWLTAYLDLPYSYAGEWFGGWADNQYNTSPGGAYEEGIQNRYGIDCSGLVCCGARWTGYNWRPWRTDTVGLAGSYYSTPISDPNNHLQPGDILNCPNVHVVSVYEYTPGHLDVADSKIIEAVGGDIDRVWIRQGVNIWLQYLRPQMGYQARELVWHGQ